MKLAGFLAAPGINVLVKHSLLPSQSFSHCYNDDQVRITHHYNNYSLIIVKSQVLIKIVQT